jgi:hypothetical protein
MGNLFLSGRTHASGPHAAPGARRLRRAARSTGSASRAPPPAPSQFKHGAKPCCTAVEVPGRPASQGHCPERRRTRAPPRAGDGTRPNRAVFQQTVCCTFLPDSSIALPAPQYSIAGLVPVSALVEGADAAGCARVAVAVGDALPAAGWAQRPLAQGEADGLVAASAEGQLSVVSHLIPLGATPARLCDRLGRPRFSSSSLSRRRRPSARRCTPRRCTRRSDRCRAAWSRRGAWAPSCRRRDAL